MGPGGTLRGCDFMVAGTFHVTSAIQKSSVFEATAHGVCLLLSGDSKKSQPLRAIAMGVDLRSNAIDTSHALRTSGHATQFTGRFQTAARLSQKPNDPQGKPARLSFGGILFGAQESGGVGG